MTNFDSGLGIQGFNTGSGPFYPAETAEEYVPTIENEEDKSYTLRSAKNNGLWICVLDYNDDHNILGVASSLETSSVFQFFEIHTPIASDPEEGFYYIRTYSQSLYDISEPYIAENGGTMKLIAGSSLENASLGAIWKITKPDLSNNSAYNQWANGTAFHIQNVSSNKYWTEGKNAPLGTTARYYNILYDAEKESYTFSGFGLDNNPLETAIGNKACVYPTSATAFGRANDQEDKMYFRLEALPTRSVTYIYQNSEGEPLMTETNNSALIGVPSNIQGTTFDFYRATSYVPDIIGKDTEEVIVTLTEELPLKFNTYYRMQLRPGDTSSNKNYDMMYDRGSDITFNPKATGNDEPISTRNSTDAEAFSLERLWYFEQVGTTYPPQVILHNVAVGESRGVTATAPTQTNTNTKCTFTQTPTTFRVVKNSTTGGAGFSLQHPDNSNCHLNDINGRLGIWNEGRSQNDKGSLFALTEVTFEEVMDGINKLGADYHYGEPNSDILGAYFKLDETKKDAANEKAKNESLSFEDIQALLTPTFAGSVDINKYYTITFLREENGAMTMAGYADAEGKIQNFDYTNTEGYEAPRFVKMQTKAASNVSQLWQFVPTTNGYNVKNLNSSYFLGTPDEIQNYTCVTREAQHGIVVAPEARAAHNAGDEINGITWVLGYNNNGQKYIHAHDTDHTNLCWSNLPGGFGETGGNVVEIRSVESVPVTIGATGWATLCLPFDVTIPEGVTVYTAESATETYVTLAELSGTIPANTGVLISVQAETNTLDPYYFTITPNATTATENNNLLTGVTLCRRGYETGSHYGLMNSGGGAVLAKNGTANVPANKAILSAEKVPYTTAGALRLGLPGSVTGIDSAATATESTDNVVFYDLNGQRVLRPTTGIYVTGDGRKVFVK